MGPVQSNMRLDVRVHAMRTKMKVRQNQFASALPQRFEHNEQRFGETCVLTGRGDQVEVGLSRQRPAICRHGGYQDVPSGVRSRSDTVRCEAFGYSSTFARLVHSPRACWSSPAQIDV